MKILELHITNIRGLPELHLKPQGRNLVIWGPNGSGKSGVVDAIDFLLSGRISRLMGRGTGGITLTRHGPHIDCSPEEASVRAMVELRGVHGPIEIERCIASPEELRCPDEARDRLRIIEDLARRGQHVLTRREILRFITAEPANRAEEIQELLNLSDIEDVRRSLVNAANHLKDEKEAAERATQAQMNTISSLVQLPGYDAAEVLRIVNENRAILGGQQLSELRAEAIQKGLSPPAPTHEPTVNPVLVVQDVEHCRRFLAEENRAAIGDIDSRLRELLQTELRDPDVKRDLAHLDLIEQGLNLIDDTGRCPLCDTDWPPGELRRHLEQKRARGKEAQRHRQQLETLSRQLKDQTENLTATLTRMRAAAERLDVPAYQVFTKWTEDLHSFGTALENPLDRYIDDAPSAYVVRFLLAPQDASSALEELKRVAEAQPQASPAQTAWDLLTRLADRLGDLEGGLISLAHAKAAADRAALVLRAFEQARNKILGDLYGEIRDRFVEFYKILHEHEADHFSATLAPHGAGLDLKVDFLGRGSHPPHALHSEGHQDSMGVCLFLALAERLSGNYLDLVVLDDVVMSVDSEHRRDICRLLTTPFPDKQFILTTHDRTWAMQLRGAAVVEGTNLIEFVRWTVETGPLVGQLSDIWERIEQALEHEDVNDAAARLRRGAEQHFEAVCDALRAPIPYRSDGRWDLGTWLPSAMHQYSALLKDAKNVAQSWSDSETFARFQELDSVRSQVFERTLVEKWALNPHIHYTNWANLSAEEFWPLVEAFRDLFALFSCSSCGQLLQLIEAEGQRVGVKCRCGTVNWNLQRR